MTYTVAILFLVFPCIWSSITLHKEDLERFHVVANLQHDPTSFTEGLFIQNGILYESTRLWGHSKLLAHRLSDMKLLQDRDLPGADFGEGIALVGNTITQLTYQGGDVYKYSKDNFQQRTFMKLPNANIIKEGWGATTNGDHLFVSDGSSTIYILNPQTMGITGSLPVRYRGFPISNLNELELIDGFIYANIFMTDCVVKIDASNGEIHSWIAKSSDMYNTANAGVDVMNGIAYDHDTQKLYVTGKNWPYMYAVEVVPDGATQDSNLDSFCLHRSMSLADFSVLVSLMRQIPTHHTSTTLMPGLETTTITKHSSAASPDQIRTYFEKHQSYFRLPFFSLKALVDVALDTTHSDEPVIDNLIQLQFHQSAQQPVPLASMAGAPAPPNEISPSEQELTQNDQELEDALNPL